jgi:hypothetical protein
MLQEIDNIIRLLFVVGQHQHLQSISGSLVGLLLRHHVEPPCLLHRKAREHAPPSYGQ